MSEAEALALEPYDETKFRRAWQMPCGCGGIAELERSPEARVCDKCDQDIDADIPHVHCKDCGWDCCRVCEAHTVLTLVPLLESSSSSSSSSSVEFTNFSRKLSKTWKKQRKKSGVNCKLVAPKVGKKKKKKKKTTRGDDDNCGKTVEMPASFWKITDGTFFKGVIQHTATWDFNGATMTGYDVLWHTGESELVPFEDIKQYL